MMPPDPDAPGAGFPERRDDAFPAGAVAVRVRLPSAAPLAVIERGPWAKPPLVVFRADGETELRAVTYDLGAAARWVLERGAGAEAVSPSPLRRRVATQAWRIYRRYRCDDVRSRF